MNYHDGLNNIYDICIKKKKINYVSQQYAFM